MRYLKCAKCGSDLLLEELLGSSEIREGFLNCKKCRAVYPIISKLPILWDDFSNYVSSRRILGGRLYRMAMTRKMRQFLKSLLSATSYVEDRTGIEDRWAGIYQNSKRSRFYSVIRQSINSVRASGLGVEYGCSVGTVISQMSQKCDCVFGVDRSFSALLEAKKSAQRNVEYVVADAFSNIFGRLQFGLVVALNVLEIMEPLVLLKKVSKQISDGTVIISDPYDFERGTNSVRQPLSGHTLRRLLSQLGFRISPETRAPSEILWSLRLNSRAVLNYRVDLVVGTKKSTG